MRDHALYYHKYNNNAMTHIYQIKSNYAERMMRRRASVAEIKLLRKFEGKQVIEERIERQLGKLHGLWFENRKEQ